MVQGCYGRAAETIDQWQTTNHTSDVGAGESVTVEWLGHYYPTDSKSTGHDGSSATAKDPHTEAHFTRADDTGKH